MPDHSSAKKPELDAATGDASKGDVANAHTASDDTLEQEQAEAAPSLRLDDALKFFGIASTGGHAKFLIQQGEVRVNGKVETRRKHRLVAGDKVTVLGEGFVMEFERNPEP